MLFCDARGKQNREQARFCGYCEQPLQAEALEPSEKVQFGELFRAECERRDVSTKRCEELMRMAAFGRTALFPHDIETQQEAANLARARDEAIPLLRGVCATDRDFPECKQLAVLPTLSFTAKRPR